MSRPGGTEGFYNYDLCLQSQLCLQQDMQLGVSRLHPVFARLHRPCCWQQNSRDEDSAVNPAENWGHWDGRLKDEAGIEDWRQPDLEASIVGKKIGMCMGRPPKTSSGPLAQSWSSECCSLTLHKPLHWLGKLFKPNLAQMVRLHTADFQSAKL